MSECRGRETRGRAPSRRARPRRHSTALALVAALALPGLVRAAPAVGQAAAAQAQAKAPLVDINSASRAELKTLPGLGDAEADRIIKARPYPSKAKLVADNVLPYPTYLGLKGRIVALQPEPAKARRSARN